MSCQTIRPRNFGAVNIIPGEVKLFSPIEVPFANYATNDDGAEILYMAYFRKHPIVTDT